MKTGEKIRLLRTVKGFSQENMADMVGISRLTYGEIERGKIEPEKERLSKIAEVLGITPEDIDAFGDSITNFFDQCNTPQVIASNSGTSNGTINHYDQKELHHQIEKLQLELKLLKAEKEKAEIEALYWRERQTSVG
jgi:XRE family transcriptional regulator, regulator of sulfur utilization